MDLNAKLELTFTFWEAPLIWESADNPHRCLLLSVTQRLGVVKEECDGNSNFSPAPFTVFKALFCERACGCWSDSDKPSSSGLESPEEPSCHHCPHRIEDPLLFWSFRICWLASPVPWNSGFHSLLSSHQETLPSQPLANGLIYESPWVKVTEANLSYMSER